MSNNRLISIWLIASIFLVYTMICVGGYTRLTHSGLSIVDWKPVLGVIPPLDEMQWQEEFSKYQNSPEFKQINSHFRIQEFKEIYLVEYFHRLLGRITGMVFVVPFLFFALTKRINSQEIKYFGSVALLFGLQGLFGWIMVKSGLIDKPNVSQYKLALHLLTACIIIIMLQIRTIRIARPIDRYGVFSVCLVLLQITSGAFVAALKAGLIFNSFPLMNGELIPNDLFFMEPWYVNFFDNVTTVQFIHRLLAFLNLINLLYYSLYLNNKLSLIVISVIAIQFTLGIATLIMQVPLFLALIHQAVAIILLMIIVYSLRERQ